MKAFGKFSHFLNLLSFIFLLYGNLAFSGVLLPIKDEIVNTENKLQEFHRHPDIDPEELALFQHYLDLLRTLPHRKFDKKWKSQHWQGRFFKFIPYPEPAIDSDLKSHLLAGIHEKNNAFPTQISDAALYDLIHSIEENIKKSPEHPKKHYHYRDSSGQTHSLELVPVAQHNYYLKFRNSLLGTGSTKATYKVISYGDFKPYALITLNNPDLSTLNNNIDYSSSRFKELIDQKDKFQNEADILSDLSRLDINQQRGLVGVKYVDSHFIVESLFSFDVFSLYSETNAFLLNKLSLSERLELISQISDGLNQLHKLGIHHSDIKEENILVKTEGFGENQRVIAAALSDFDISYFPEHLIKLRQRIRPLCGTWIYLAPELYEMDHSDNFFWRGTTTEEQVNTVLKSDVFGLATVSLNLFEGNKTSAPWVGKCLRFMNKEEHSFEDTRRFAKCQRYQLNNFLIKQNELETLDYFHYLVALGSHPDPLTRIDSHQWAQGIRILQDQLIQFQTSSGVTHPIALSDDDLSTLYSHIHYWPKEKENEAITRLKTEPKGTYLFIEKQLSSNENYISIAFLDYNAKTQIKIFPIDYSRPSLFEKSVQFLKSIGILKNQIEFTQ